MNRILLWIVEHISTFVAYAQQQTPAAGPILNIPKFENPLAKAGINDLPSFIETILKFVVDLGTPLIAIAFIWTGLQYVLAQGNPEKLKNAHRAAKYTFIGAILILGAFVVTKVISATIGEVID
ncbi:MAG TPA: pilin [Candidatus Paceibacterota bacterium]